jgi:hypothetical protein
MVARDGIEPPTKGLFRAAGLIRRASAKKAASAASNIQESKNMVARDGIEPPTPAFSGPRSTTELPGLSADYVVAFVSADSEFAG